MENLLPQKKNKKNKFTKEKALRSEKKRGTRETHKLNKNIKTFFLQAREIILSCIKVSNVPEESRKQKKFKNHQTEWRTHSNLLIL